MKKWLALGALLATLGCSLGEVPPPAAGGPSAEGATPDPGDARLSDTEAARAGELLDRARSAYEAVDLEGALEASTEVINQFPSTDSAAAARLLAARSALSLERYEEARELAEPVVADRDSARAGEARDLTEMVEDALEPSPRPVRLGVLLPRSGSRVLVRYADWVLEGIELAVDEAERKQGRRIELVVVDDEGGARVNSGMDRLQREGSLAVIGPLLPAHMRSAAMARTSGLVLLSPTVTEEPGWPEAYSVNSVDARGAEDLGRYAAQLGFGQAAILYPRLPDYERKMSAFARAFRAGGGEVRAVVPYDSGTTTFEAHMQRILQQVAGPPRRPFALFVPAPQRDVPQIAPQVSFYGLGSAGVQVFGDDAWASSAVRRVVRARDLEGVIATSNFPPNGGSELADSAFTRAYEQRYRKTLENPLPAYGYDAARLLLEALPNRQLTPEALALRFHLLARIPGATGVLSVRNGEVVRVPYLVRIRARELQPAPEPWTYQLPVPRPPTEDEPGRRRGRPR